MGNSPSTPSSRKLKRQHVFQRVVGQGACGTVWQALHLPSGQCVAVKQMNKHLLCTRKFVFAAKIEMALLTQLSHPFLPQIFSAFQDQTHLYLVTTYFTGGNFRRYMQENSRISEKQARFFVACLVLVLEYLHGQKIVHRDVKPENLLLDHEGYLHLVDFGNARKFTKRVGKERSGTLGYMAPEVVFRLEHGPSVDFFAVGAILYELMMESKPYIGRTVNELQECMEQGTTIVSPSLLSRGWSAEALDFCNRLVRLVPRSRLGNAGVHEVKSHPWLQSVCWQDLYAKTIASPFKVSEGVTIEVASENQSVDNDVGSIDPSLFAGYLYSRQSGNKLSP